MKKFTAFLLCFALCIALVACGGNSENTDSEKDSESTPGAYTAEGMIDEIKQMFDGVDVSDIVNEKDVSSMTTEEQTEFITYLYNYAHYKDMTVEDYLESDIPNASDETAELIKKELEDKGFDSADADTKIEVGSEVAEKYSFYDYSEEEAIKAIAAYYSTDEDNSKAMLTEHGYYDTEDAAARSKILYLLLVTY